MQGTRPGAKISVVANATRAEAARLRLVEVRRALDGLIDLAGEIRDLRDALSTIAKKDVPARLDAVLDLLARLEQRARAALD
jgi:hypothetical protein